MITRLSDNSLTARYVYDGDGKRIISIAGTTSTVSVGDLFEAVIGASDTPEDYTLDRGFANRVYFPAILQEDAALPPVPSSPEYHTHPAKPAGGILWRTYYYAGGQRVGTRETTAAGMADVFYLLSDHLGSTTVTVDKNGMRTAELFYKAWGEIDPSRTYGTTPTQRRYTGQYQADVGLYFYNARWYDPALSRWTQPDTLVPDPYNAQDWDRYSYVRGNPVNYIDPSGHCGILCAIIYGVIVYGSITTFAIVNEYQLYEQDHPSDYTPQATPFPSPTSEISTPTPSTTPTPTMTPTKIKNSDTLSTAASVGDEVFDFVFAPGLPGDPNLIYAIPSNGDQRIETAKKGLEIAGHTLWGLKEALGNSENSPYLTSTPAPTATITATRSATTTPMPSVTPTLHFKTPIPTRKPQCDNR